MSGVERNTRWGTRPAATECRGIWLRLPSLRGLCATKAARLI